MDSLPRIVQRILVGVCIALVLAGVHHLALAGGTVTGSANNPSYWWGASSSDTAGRAIYELPQASATSAGHCAAWRASAGYPTPFSGNINGTNYLAGHVVNVSGAGPAHSQHACAFCFPQNNQNDTGCTGASGGYYVTGAFLRQTGSVAGCPSNAASVGGVCTCNSGFVPNAGATACQALSGACATIVAGANSLGGGGNGYNFTGAASPGTLSLCTGGCQIGATGATFNRDSSGAWQGQFYGPFTLENSTCNPTAAAPPAAAASAPCPFGQAPGQVNGATICAPTGVTTTGSSAAASAPAGAASAPASTIGPDGASIGIPAGGSATSSTTCGPSGCTKTTTVRDASGNKVGEVSETKPKDTFCQENPEISICKSSTFSGSCPAAFVCDGDAIQCAIAREQHRRGCQLFETTSPETAAGIAAVAGGDRPAGHPGLASVATALDLSTSINQSSLLGGAACPSDVTLDLGYLGQRTFGFSGMCGQLNALAAVLKGLALLSAAFIVFGGGRRT